MKIEVNDKQMMMLTNIFNPIAIQSTSGQQISICLSDGGFEIIDQTSRNLISINKGKISIAPLVKTEGLISFLERTQKEEGQVPGDQKNETSVEKTQESVPDINRSVQKTAKSVSKDLQEVRGKIDELKKNKENTKDPVSGATAPLTKDVIIKLISFHQPVKLGELQQILGEKDTNRLSVHLSNLYKKKLVDRKKDAGVGFSYFIPESKTGDFNIDKNGKAEFKEDPNGRIKVQEIPSKYTEQAPEEVEEKKEPSIKERFASVRNSGRERAELMLELFKLKGVLMDPRDLSEESGYDKNLVERTLNTLFAQGKLQNTKVANGKIMHTYHYGLKEWFNETGNVERRRCPRVVL